MKVNQISMYGVSNYAAPAQTAKRNYSQDNQKYNNVNNKQANINFGKSGILKTGFIATILAFFMSAAQEIGTTKLAVSDANAKLTAALARNDSLSKVVAELKQQSSDTVAKLFGKITEQNNTIEVSTKKIAALSKQNKKLTVKNTSLSALQTSHEGGGHGNT